MKDTKPRCWARMGLLMTVKRERRVEVEMDAKMGVQRAPTNQEKTISHGLYKGTEMSREVKRASERRGGGR